LPCALLLCLTLLLCVTPHPITSFHTTPLYFPSHLIVPLNPITLFHIIASPRHVAPLSTTTSPHFATSWF
jgi:hypothetical protein